MGIAELFGLRRRVLRDAAVVFPDLRKIMLGDLEGFQVTVEGKPLKGCFELSSTELVSIPTVDAAELRKMLPRGPFDGSRETSWKEWGGHQAVAVMKKGHGAHYSWGSAPVLFAGSEFIKDGRVYLLVLEMSREGVRVPYLRAQLAPETQLLRTFYC